MKPFILVCMGLLFLFFGDWDATQLGMVFFVFGLAEAAERIDRRFRK